MCWWQHLTTGSEASTTGNVYQGCLLTTLFPSPIMPELPLPKFSGLPYKSPRIIFRRVSEMVVQGEKDHSSFFIAQQCPNSKIASNWTRSPESSIQQCSSSSMLESHYLRNYMMPCRALRVTARTGTRNFKLQSQSWGRAFLRRRSSSRRTSRSETKSLNTRILVWGTRTCGCTDLKIKKNN